MIRATKMITITASIATIIGTLFLFIPNQATSDTQTSSGNQSPNIHNSNGNTSVNYGNTTINNPSSTSGELFLENAILFAKPSLDSYANKICQVETGSKINLLTEQKDSTMGAIWIKVKVLDGTCIGKEGWTGKDKLIRK